MREQSEVASIQFGLPKNGISPERPCLELAIPVLAGNSASRLPFGIANCYEHEDWRVYESDSVICAFCVAPVGQLLAPVARRLYREAFEIAGDRHLYRFWNFVPRINEIADGLENYRSFGTGRHEAFFEHFGPSASARMPAATGVGTDGDSLAVCMLAGNNKPDHFENPNQVPAHQYPDDYGPRPPSFCRGTVVSAIGRQVSFVAGTASVRGHLSIGTGNLESQIEVIRSNLESIGAKMGLNPALGRGSGYDREFRVYLRNKTELAAAHEQLSESLFESGDNVIWLRSDICRSDLDIEIEATLVR